MSMAVQLHEQRVIQDTKHYTQHITNIQKSATQSATMALTYQDTVKRIVDGDAVSSGSTLVEEVKKSYKKIRDYQLLTVQYIQTFAADMANPALSVEDKEKMKKMIKALKAADAQFTERMPNLLYRANDYINVLLTSRELSGWQAGIVWTADPHGLNKQEALKSAASPSADGAAGAGEVAAVAEKSA